MIVKKQVSADRALRLRTALGYENNEQPLVKGVNPYSYTASVDFGYEKQKRVKKLVTYWGGELNLRYVILNAWPTNEGSDPILSAEKIHDYGRDRYIGFSLFAGAKYFLTNHISLSMESALTARYEIQENFERRYDKDGRPKGSMVRSSYSNFIDTSIIPLSVFYLNFHF